MPSVQFQRRPLERSHTLLIASSLSPANFHVQEFTPWIYSHTHTKSCVQEHSLNRTAYWFSIAAMTKYHKLSHIKQHPLIISQFHGLEIGMQAWFSWVLCLGSYQAEIKRSAGLCYFSGALWRNLLPHSFRSFAESSLPLHLQSQL